MKTLVNKANVFTANLETSIKNIEDRVRSALFQILQDDSLISEIKPTQKGTEYEAVYSFPEIGRYETIWKFDIGGVDSIKKGSVEVMPDVEISSDISTKYSPSQKTGCQLMAEQVLGNHELHYHGQIDLKDNLKFVDNYKGRKGFFIKKLIINDKLNLNDWKATWDAIQKDGHEFIGKPIVRTPDKDHPPVSIQDDYRVGEYIDVELHDVDRSLWGVGQIFDEKTQQMIMDKEIEFGSPTVLVRSESTREQKFKGTPQQQDILHRFKPAHDALVGNPAYGKEVDHIKAVCTGDGPACALKLLEVSASVQYRDFHAAIARKAETPEEAGYVRTAIPRECGTCKYFEKPNICTWPISIPVDPKLDCCKHWSPQEKIPGDIIYESEINSDNTNQLTIVPFVRKILKQRFSSDNLKDIVGNILQADSDSCVSKKIKIIADEHPSWEHDKVIAVAYSYCQGNTKEGEIEDTIMRDLSTDLITISRNVEQKHERIEKSIKELQNKFH